MAFHNDRAVLARRGMVCSVDHLASAVGVAVLRAGGNAADAAVTVPFTTPAGGATLDRTKGRIRRRPSYGTPR